MPGEDVELVDVDASVAEGEIDDELSATPRRATNIGGGGQADNTCDCSTIGLERAHEPMAHGVNGSALCVVALAALFARRRRVG